MSDEFDQYGNKNYPSINSKNPKENYNSYPDENQTTLTQASIRISNISANDTENCIAVKCEESLSDLVEELNTMIGLGRVKQEVIRMIQYVKIQKLRTQYGISNSAITLHSVYTGNPGTGKTSIARLYGKMLKSMGLLSKGHLVETDRAGLVGSYVGQTTNKTDEKIKEAIGGVLFIDEAYSLYKGDSANWDYGLEAIDILVKRMEDYRHDLAVIIAGYPDPMGKLLDANEGFRSRFSTYLFFEDYSPQELLQIFLLFCRHENYEIYTQAVNLVSESIIKSYNNRTSTFGNARFIRNLFELVIRNQAYRVGMLNDNPSVNDLKVIMPMDIPATPIQTII